MHSTEEKSEARGGSHRSTRRHAPSTTSSAPSARTESTRHSEAISEDLDSQRARHSSSSDEETTSTTSTPTHSTTRTKGLGMQPPFIEVSSTSEASVSTAKSAGTSSMLSSAAPGPVTSTDAVPGHVATTLVTSSHQPPTQTSTSHHTATTDLPPASGASPGHRHGDDSPTLSNGATAGVVLAVVAVVLAAGFLLRYIYKTKGLCGKGRSFSPLEEPYHRSTNGSGFNNSARSGELENWLAHHGAGPHAHATPTPSWPPTRPPVPTGQAESVELQTFTRPVHTPKLYDVSNPGIPSRQGSSPGQKQGYGGDGNGGPWVGSPQDRGALPWDDNFRADRYRAW